MHDLAYIEARVEVSAGLPMEVQLSSVTGLVELRLGRVCAVTLSMDRHGMNRMFMLLDQCRERFEAGLSEPDGSRREGWEPG